LLAAPVGAEGVFDPYFERDGDATDQPASTAFPASSEDWETTNKMPGTNYPGAYTGPSLIRSGVVPDFVGLGAHAPAADQYFASICKDVVDLSSCTIKEVAKVTPNKDDIVNVAVTTYVYNGPEVPVDKVTGNDGNVYPTANITHKPGDLLVFWMAELYAPNGDASIGGWILKNPLNIPAAGTLGKTGYTFGTSPRSVGDIFIEGDFYSSQQTEDQVTMSVFLWDPGAPGAISGTLLPVVHAGGAMRCTDNHNALACALSNNKHIGEVPTYWPFATSESTKIDKSPIDANGDGQPDVYPVSTFFEMGINLSATLRAAGRELGCYTNFLTETRASHSETADGKDLVTGTLPLCSLSVDKTGPTLSKIGDTTTYNILITNTGVVPLHKRSVNDTVLGDLTSLTTGSTCGATLEPQQSCSITVNRTPVAGDPDPLGNTVTAIYDFGSDQVSASDSHSVNLFQPGVQVTKTGSALSKIGDPVTYQFTIRNTSSADTPTLQLDSIADDKLGNLAASIPETCRNLASGASCTFSVNSTVPAGVPDPFVNRVTVHYHPTGFRNDIHASDTHSVNLFQPSVDVDKTGETLSKIGDSVTYTYTIRNTSSADTPNLVLDFIQDDKLGNLTTTAPAACGTLASGASCSFNVTRTVPAGASDPYVNNVQVRYHPSGFTNHIEDQSSHSVNLFQPSFTLGKTCAPARVKVGDPLTYTYTLSNTSSADSPKLNRVTVTDSKLPTAGTSFPSALNAGQSATVSLSYYPMTAGAVTNNVSATYQVEGFSNRLTQTASATCEAYVGDQGCTPGFWKNHPEYWDGLGTDDKTHLIKYNQFFNSVLDGMYGAVPIDVTSSKTKLADTVTLMGAVNLAGGGLSALNRHTAAALASADSVDYPYSVQGVKVLYWDALGLISGPETISSALKKLSDANELNCPY